MRVSVCVAKVACVKSRDMHWALVAHKDQKDINLSSLRMLLVADGSNPCESELRLSSPSPAPSASLDHFREALAETEREGEGEPGKTDWVPRERGELGHFVFE